MLYAPHVRDSTVSFETDPPDAEEMARRAGAEPALPWLVAAGPDDRAVGYAYATPHRSRAGYRFSVETSVYVAEPGHGVGRALMLALLEACTARGLVSAYAGVALPNEPSIALHRRLGFTPVGVFPRVGWKLGRLVDVSWWYRPLAEPLSQPAGRPASEPLAEPPGRP